MNVIVDTCVWSLALRRKKRVAGHLTAELAELIDEGRVVMLGPVRQELLSGVKDDPQFELLRDRLRAFPDLPLSNEDFEEAAATFNQCRRQGVQGSNTDFLICAAARKRSLPIFTTDKDFELFSEVLDLSLHELRGSGV